MIRDNLPARMAWVRQTLPGDSPIRMEWFYRLHDEKTKLGWYLLELALEYYGRIMDSPELGSYRERYSEGQIAQYCAYYARRLKESLLKYMRGQRKTVCCDYMLAGERIITVRLACPLCESTSLVRRNHPAAARHPSTGGELKRDLTPFPSFGEVPSVGGGVVQSPQPHSLKYFESSFARIV